MVYIYYAVICMIMFKINKYLHSSCRTLIRLSLVTRLIPAVSISDGPLRHNTVSFENGAIITHVRRASLPSATIDGPPVPTDKFEKKKNVRF